MYTKIEITNREYGEDWAHNKHNVNDSFLPTL